jgi:hypothetical protein
VTRSSNTSISGDSPAGTGKDHPVIVTVDGYVSTLNEVLISFTPPNITSIPLNPPFAGGKLKLHSTHLGVVIGDISVEVFKHGETSCGIECTAPEFAESNNGTNLQCDYNVAANKGDCKDVVVTVNGQSSLPHKYCYKSNVGGITINTNLDQSVSENGTLAYKVGLSTGLTRSHDVILHVKAESSESGFTCTVSPTVSNYHPLPGSTS